MTINIPQNILDLNGQCVNEIILSDDGEKLVIHCSRDARRRAVDPATGKKGSINQHVRRQVRDIPLFGYPCVIDIELAQVFINKGERRIEGCDFVVNINAVVFDRLYVVLAFEPWNCPGLQVHLR